MRLSEGRGPGSNPGRETEAHALRVCRIARQSSKLPGEVRFLGRVLDNNMSSGCAGFARDPAKVEDQVRFLARTLNERRRSQTARRLPAKQLQVGSTPTDVFEAPGPAV